MMTMAHDALQAIRGAADRHAALLTMPTMDRWSHGAPQVRYHFRDGSWLTEDVDGWLARASMDVLTDGAYTVRGYDAGTGRLHADSDTGSAQYLRAMALSGGRPGEIAVAIRQDERAPTLYLLPGSHEWVATVPPVLAPGSRSDPIRWERVSVTAHAATTQERAGIQVAWDEVERVLGRPHQGYPGDDERLVEALLRADAPAWVRDAEGWTDGHGWGLIGPVTVLP